MEEVVEEVEQEDFIQAATPAHGTKRKCSCCGSDAMACVRYPPPNCEYTAHVSSVITVVMAVMAVAAVGLFCFTSPPRALWIL